MAQAAHEYSKNPRQLSFKLAMQLIESFRQKGLLIENSKAYNELLKSIVCKKVGNRPGRSEPRKVKRRPKPFPRLQEPRSSHHKKAA